MRVSKPVEEPARVAEEAWGGSLRAEHKLGVEVEACSTRDDVAHEVETQALVGAEHKPQNATPTIESTWESGLCHMQRRCG